MKPRKLVTTFSTTLVVAALAAAWAVASPLAAGCATAVPIEHIVNVPSQSSNFVSSINQLRASHGLGSLSVDGNLTSVAQDWAVHMAAQDGISHRVNLSDGIHIDWRRLGENVGMGPNVSDLMRAFIASPGHYKNLVDPIFTHVGVGTVSTPDGLLYTAHVFAAMQGASAPSPQYVAPAPAPPTPSTPLTPKAPVRQVAPPRVTTPPTSAAPAPTTVPEPAVNVERSPAEQDELQDGRAENHQQQQHKNQGRCRAHRDLRVVV